MNYFVSNLPSFLSLVPLVLIAFYLRSILESFTVSRNFLEACEKLALLPKYVNPYLSRLVCENRPGTKIRGVKPSDYFFDAAKRFEKDHGVVIKGLSLFGQHRFLRKGTFYEEAELMHSEMPAR